MTTELQYRQAILSADVHSLQEIENRISTEDLRLFSRSMRSTYLRRRSSSMTAVDAVRALAQHAFDLGESSFAAKQLFRLERSGRLFPEQSATFSTYMQNLRVSEFSPMDKIRAVHLSTGDTSNQVVGQLLPSHISSIDVPLPTDRQSDALNHLHNVILGTVDDPDGLILFVLADGSSEVVASQLSRLTHLPLIIIQLDLVPGKGNRVRPRPFEPVQSIQQFPPSVWLRYGGHPKNKVQAWDIDTGMPVQLETQVDLRPALNFLIPREVYLHDIQSYGAAPYEGLQAAPSVVTWWNAASMRALKNFDLIQADFVPTVLEHYWSQPQLNEVSAHVLARLENHIAGLDETSRIPSLNHAYSLNRRSFLDQLVIRELWTNNEYQEIFDYVEWAGRPLDSESQRIEAEARAALELLGYLDSQTLPAASRDEQTTQGETIVSVLHGSVPHQSGGYAVRAHGIFTALAASGADIVPVTRPGFGYDAQNGSGSETVDNITYHRLPTLASYSYGEAQYMLESVELYKDFFKNSKATKVHARSTYLIAIPAIIAAHQLGLKVVYEVSGLWELVYRGQETQTSLKRRSTFGEFWETQAAKAADAVMTMNAPMKDLLVQRGAEPTRISLAPNAVDVERFKPSSSKHSRPRIGYIGSIVDYENIPLLLKAVRNLVNEGLTFDVRIIGDGSQFSNSLAFRQRLQLEDVVSMPGRIPHDQVAGEYEQMDIMVYPRKSTLATDTVTPLKPFEALAMGKAVVVSDVPPLREIAGDGERAVMFPAGSVSGLTDALRSLLQNRELRNQLGQAGREWVVNERSWTQVVQAFKEAYAKL